MLNNFSWYENNSNFYNEMILSVTLDDNTTYIVEANDDGCYNSNRCCFGGSENSRIDASQDNDDY